MHQSFEDSKAKIEDLAARQAALAAEQAAASRAEGGVPSQASKPVFDKSSIPSATTAPVASAGSDESVDESGIDPKDIALLIS